MFVRLVHVYKNYLLILEANTTITFVQTIFQNICNVLKQSRVLIDFFHKSKTTLEASLKIGDEVLNQCDLNLIEIALILSLLTMMYKWKQVNHCLLSKLIIIMYVHIVLGRQLLLPCLLSLTKFY